MVKRQELSAPAGKEGRMKGLRSADRGRKTRSEKRVQERETNVTSEPREFYTVSQLANLLQLTEMTIYRMINRGELPCYAIGRIKRFRHGDVEEFLEQCRVPGTEKPPTS